MLTLQGVCAALAGTLAERMPPGAAMEVIAGTSVAVTLALAPGLRTGEPVRGRSGDIVGCRVQDAPRSGGRAVGGDARRR
ncbi:hypothetical protein ACWCP6_21100 [Streptomyces sp. NPDC002004]